MLRTALLSAALTVATLASSTARAETLVVAHKSDATVALFDLETRQRVATLPTGEGPHEAAISPDGRYALISNYGSREQPGATLTLVAIESAQVVRTIPLGEFQRPHGLAWLPQGLRALVTAEAQRSLLEIDLEAPRLLRTVATEQEVSHMVVRSPDGTRAYVANIGSGSVTAIDLAQGQRVATVVTGAGTEGIDLTPDGRELWVTQRAADTVKVLSAQSLETLATLTVPSFPIRARVTPDGRFVLVTCARSNDLAVLAVAERRLVRRIPFASLAASPGAQDGRLLQEFGTSSVPIGVAIDAAGKRAFVALSNADRIAILDLSRWEIVDSLPTSKEPDGIGVSPIRVRPPGAE